MEDEFGGWDQRVWVMDLELWGGKEVGGGGI